MANHVHAYRSVIVHGLLSLHCIVESLPLAHNAQHCPSIYSAKIALTPPGGGSLTLAPIILHIYILKKARTSRRSLRRRRRLDVYARARIQYRLGA